MQLNCLNPRLHSKIDWLMKHIFDNNKKILTIRIFLVVIMLTMSIGFSACIAEEPVVPPDIQVTQTSNQTAVIVTQMPEDIQKSSELTNGVVLVGVVLVLIIVGGTFVGIRRMQR